MRAHYKTRSVVSGREVYLKFKTMQQRSWTSILISMIRWKMTAFYKIIQENGR